MEVELKKLGGEFHEFISEDKYSQHFKWLVPCYFKSAEINDMNRMCIYLEINTVTKKRELHTKKERDVIDFEDLPVGFKKIENICLLNRGEHDVEIKIGLLSQFGGFEVINALRTISKGGEGLITIQFQPHNKCGLEFGGNRLAFSEQLHIQAFSDQIPERKGNVMHGKKKASNLNEEKQKFCTSSLTLTLKGIGVKPEVNMYPPNKLLDIGAILLGDDQEAEISIENLTKFTLQFELISLARGLQNSKGLRVFTFTPSKGSIGGNEIFTIKVIFKPDRISENFYELIEVFVPDQINKKQLFIKGACYPRQAYISYFKPFLFPTEEELEVLKQEIESPLDFLLVIDETSIISVNQNIIEFQFNDDKEYGENDIQYISKKLVIGNCSLNNKNLEKVVNYKIIIPNKNEDVQGSFKCKIMEEHNYQDNKTDYSFFEGEKLPLIGQIKADEQIILKFGYTPPKKDNFLSDIPNLKMMGQWVKVIGKIIVQGGYIGHSCIIHHGKKLEETLNCDLILKAFINNP